MYAEVLQKGVISKDLFDVCSVGVGGPGGVGESRPVDGDIQLKQQMSMIPTDCRNI